MFRTRFDHSPTPNPPIVQLGGPAGSPVLHSHAERMFMLSDLAAVATHSQELGRLVVVYRPERLAELIWNWTQSACQTCGLCIRCSRPAKWCF